MTMSGWTTDVLIYSFIVGLLLPRYDDLAFTFSTNYLNTVELLGIDSTIPCFTPSLASREPKYIICIAKPIEAFAAAGTSLAVNQRSTEVEG
jgi:hypothetical protein